MNRYYWEAWQWMRFRDPLSRQWPEMMTTTANSSSSWFQQRWLLAYWYFATTDNATRPWPFCNPPNVLDADVENDDDACIYQKLVAAGTIETANQYMKVPWIRFLTNRSECDWVGVTCSQDGVVEALDYSEYLLISNSLIVFC